MSCLPSLLPLLLPSAQCPVCTLLLEARGGTRHESSELVWAGGPRGSFDPLTVRHASVIPHWGPAHCTLVRIL